MTTIALDEARYVGEWADDEHAHRIGFYLIPGFSMIAFVAALEPLRLANLVAGKTLYSWYTMSHDNGPVFASNSVSINVGQTIDEVPALETIFVCGGIDVQNHQRREFFGFLRKQAAHGTGLGALCTGAHVLARAGLLVDHRCTIHWENLPAFIEEFPDIEVTSELYEIDRKRYTCAGGTAAADLMLNFISEQTGPEIAAQVADELILHRIREKNEGQRMDLRARLGISHPKLLAVVSLMDENLETPLNASELALSVGLSTRQLERLFSTYLKTPPTRYYLQMRLKRARYLLRQTSLPIFDVALAAGFVSASHFSKCYREEFNRTPSAERRGIDTTAMTLPYAVQEQGSGSPAQSP
ncbi:MAG: GlxA family transcriptional regulator [Alphaproteobacteria bacterium]|nr:GlxA family transcriptional regulator [Alphaproteobacteria bacterium]